MRVCGETGMNGAAGTKNSADGAFFGRVVNRMTRRGRGRVLVPIDLTVSALDTPLLALEVMMN
jgi:hypothetical protein